METICCVSMIVCLIKVRCCKYTDSYLILPFNADSDETEHGGVQREHEDVSVQSTEHCAEQPPSIKHELNDVRHSNNEDQKIGHGQVDNEQIGHGASHLLVGEHDDNHEGIANDANDDDEGEETRNGYEWSGVDSQGNRHVGSSRVLHGAARNLVERVNAALARQAAARMMVDGRFEPRRLTVRMS